MRNHHFTLPSALIACALIAGPAAAGGQFGFMKRGDPKAEYTPFKDPSGQFAMEFPKDWQVVGGAGDVTVTFAQRKSEAALVVERFKLNTSLAPEDVTDLFTQIETEVLKDRQPKATQVTARVVEQNGLRLIVIDYARPGLAGPERARQYSFPVGPVLYRLTCSAITAQFVKYDPMFVHVAETFKVERPSTGAPDAR